MNVIPIDDEDDVEVVYADVLPSTYNFLSQEMELLQAFAVSTKPIPMEFNQFYNCAKEVKKTYSDAVILSAWKRSITKELSHMLRPNTGPTSPPQPKAAPTAVIDLTELTEPPAASIPTFVPSTLLSPPTTEEVPEPSAASRPRFVPSTLLSQPVTEEVVPVALFANPIVQRSTSNSQSASDHDNVKVTSCSEQNSKVESDCDIINFEHYQSKTKEPCDSSSDEDTEAVTEVDPLSSTTESNMFNKTVPTGNSIISSDNSSTDGDYDFYFKNNAISSRGRDPNPSFAPKCRKRKLGETKMSCSLTDLTENKNHTIIDSYVGVQAKITRVQPLLKPKKRNTKKCNYMSETELKVFRKEQKQQKLREKRELASKQLEIVHDRLVDILIPKYFKKVKGDKH